MSGDPTPSVLTARGVAVGGAHRPLLLPTDLTLRTGEVLVAAGDPGHGHTALALALAGRLRHEGAVEVDGDSGVRRLQRAVALVDVPGVSEPDAAVPVAAVVGEELAIAGRHAGRSAVRTVLEGRELESFSHKRFDALDVGARVALLCDLAARRPEVRFVVLTLPDRHGGTPESWLPALRDAAHAGLGVLVTTGVGTARLLDLPTVAIGLDDATDGTSAASAQPTTEEKEPA